MALELNGTTGVSEVKAGIVTDDKLALSANSAEVKEALNATGSAPIYACRAWVNFDGTGTVSIRDSGNVSSVSDFGTGKYTINFATAMPDTNYAVLGGSFCASNAANFTRVVSFDDIATSSLSVLVADLNGPSFSDRTAYVAIFR